MKNRKWTRFLSGVLSAAMVVTLSPSVSFAAESSSSSTSEEDGILAHFSFDDESTGLSGGGSTATIEGSGISFESDAAIGNSILIGDSSYLSVEDADGNSPLTGQDAITINYYSKPTCSGTGWTFFAVRDGETPTYNSEHYLGIMDQTGSMKVERYLSTGSRAATNDVSGTFTSWKMVTVVMDEDSTTLYINGVKQNEVASSYKLTDILGDNSTLQIGKANWTGGEYYKGYIDEFTIYDHALTDGQVSSLYGSNMIKVAANEVKTTLGADSDNKVYTEKDLKLPATTSNGCTVSWTSSNTAVVATDGKVTRPAAGEADATATLSASISTPEINSRSDSTSGPTPTTSVSLGVKVDYEVTVAAQKTDAQIVDLAADEITLNQTENIKGNITLPTENSYGATVTWTSSNPDVISDKEVVNEDYDNMPAGLVTRQDKDTAVTLTATISYGTATTTKTFDVTVLKKAEEKVLEDYLFAFFPSNSEEQLYFAAGTDNLHFTDLNDGEPVLTSTIGDQGVRDPYIFRSAEGDHFYMLATDLKVQTTGWSKAQYSGSLEMVVWESDDLVNWTDARLVDVGLNDLLLSDDDITNLGCLWAPEAIYDEKTGEYVVYWASMTTDKTTGLSYQITYYSKTRDFVTFTDATEYIDRGAYQHCIDSSIVEANGKYYRASVCGTANGGTTGEIMLETSDSILGDWTKLCDMSDLQDGMEGYSDFYNSTKIQFKTGTVEGTELFTLNDGKTWGLYTDNYGGVGYIPVTTTDLSDTTGKSWKVYSTSEYDFGSLKKRHGSILGITKEEYEAVMAKWGSKEVTNDEDAAEDAVLSYDFEDTSSSTAIADASGNNYTGTLNGNATVVKDSETDSNVLSLDGTSGTYAQFPTGFFDGRDTFTISFDMKASTVSGDFFDLAIGKSSSKYIFLRARDTSTYLAITTNSWSSEEGITASTSSIANSWHNFTAVFADSTMKLYIDGELAGEKDITNKVSDFGSNVIAYLGKSFYSADSYVNAYYDNVKVYNRGLSEVEIAKANGVVLDSLKGVESSDVTIITEDKDQDNIVLYVSKNNTDSSVDWTNVTLDFDLLSGAKIVSGQKAYYDLTSPFQITVDSDGEQRTYTISTVKCNNPVLGGQYADPDIDCFNGKYYIYPTTDGYEGWSGYQFHVFSSDDLINWTDEGVILDLKADEDYTDENGRTVAAVPWSDGSAWAPTIEEKDGMYYFYFCGNDTSTNSKAIGVAYSTSPTGPFTVAPDPVITYSSSKALGVTIGQAIDPSVFKDVDGTYYLSYGNGNGTAGLAKLSDDMLSVESATAITGLNSFRESLIITYRDGLYHYTWSCDDTGSEDYHINYAVSKELGKNITYKGTILSKDTDSDILGTGHHSILNVPGTDDWYIVYHRFLTPLGQVSSGYGYHRETCIDKLTFDEETGLMNVVTPTLTGITEPVYVPGYEPKSDDTSDDKKEDTTDDNNDGTTDGASTPSTNKTEAETCQHSYVTKVVAATTEADGYTVEVCSKCNQENASSKKTIRKIGQISAANATYTGKALTPAVTVLDADGNAIDSAYYTVSYTDNTKVGKATATVEFKGNYSGTVSVSFKINPKSLKIKSLKKAKKSFKVKWAKQSGVTGYEISYSTDSKFKKSVNTVKVTKKSATSTVVKKKVKASKKYYVRIRAYKTVNGVKYYSAWSSAKSVKTK